MLKIENLENLYVRDIAYTQCRQIHRRIATIKTLALVTLILLIVLFKKDARLFIYEILVFALLGSLPIKFCYSPNVQLVRLVIYPIVLIQILFGILVRPGSELSIVRYALVLFYLGVLPRSFKADKIILFSALTLGFVTELLEKIFLHSGEPRIFYPIFVFTFSLFFVATNEVRIRQSQSHLLYDPVSGLYNLSFRDYVLRSLESQGADDFYLMGIKIQSLKRINETYGYQFGDRLIRAVSFIVKKESSPRAWCFRTGGGELTLILPDMSFEDSLALAGAVRSSLDQEGFCSGICDKIAFDIALVSSEIQPFDEGSATLDKLETAFCEGRRSQEDKILVL